MDTIQHRYAEVNTIRMHYATAGNGPLLILLHGFPEFWYSWHDQIMALQSSFTVVAPDLRGYNQTDKPAWGYEADVLLADIVELIGTLGHTQAIVVGSGWGGMLAWSLAIFYPHRVSRLVTLHAPHPALLMNTNNGMLRRTRHTLVAALLRLPWLPEMFLSANDYKMIEKLLRGRAGSCINGRDAEAGDFTAYKDAASKPGALTAMLNWYRFSPWTGAHTCPHPICTLFCGKHVPMNVNVPALTLWGEGDRERNISLIEETSRYVPDFHLVRVPDCSHRVLIEQPDLVSRSLRDFLVGEAI